MGGAFTLLDIIVALHKHQFWSLCQVAIDKCKPRSYNVDRGNTMTRTKRRCECGGYQWDGKES